MRFPLFGAYLLIIDCLTLSTYNVNDITIIGFYLSICHTCFSFRLSTPFTPRHISSLRCRKQVFTISQQFKGFSAMYPYITGAILFTRHTNASIKRLSHLHNSQFCIGCSSCNYLNPRKFVL